MGRILRRPIKIWKIAELVLVPHARTCHAMIDESETENLLSQVHKSLLALDAMETEILVDASHYNLVLMPPTIESGKDWAFPYVQTDAANAESDHKLPELELYSDAVYQAYTQHAGVSTSRASTPVVESSGAGLGGHGLICEDECVLSFSREMTPMHWSMSCLPTPARTPARTPLRTPLRTPVQSPARPVRLSHDPFELWNSPARSVKYKGTPSQDECGSPR